METLKIEDYPEHWRSTLLGIDFWKDAEIHNQPIHNDIEAGKSWVHFFIWDRGSRPVISRAESAHLYQIPIQHWPRGGSAFPRPSVKPETVFSRGGEGEGAGQTQDPSSTV